MARLEDVLGIDPPLAPPLARPDPPQVVERATKRYMQEVEREAVESEIARPPARSARKTLKARIDENADALASHAVDEALSTKGRDAVASVKALIDTADSPEVRIPVTAEEIEGMSFIELTRAVAVIAPERLTEADRRLIGQ